jgi:hypothetical protein
MSLAGRELAAAILDACCRTERPLKRSETGVSEQKAPFLLQRLSIRKAAKLKRISSFIVHTKILCLSKAAAQDDRSPRRGEELECHCSFDMRQLKRYFFLVEQSFAGTARQVTTNNMNNFLLKRRQH